MGTRLPLFGTAMVFAALTNGLAFVVFGRMRSLGHRIGVWRTYSDWILYREYRRIAPERNWSRVPIIVGLLSFFVLAFVFMCLWIKGTHLPH